MAKCMQCGESEGRFFDPEFSGDKICLGCVPGRYVELIDSYDEEIKSLRTELAKILKENK